MPTVYARGAPGWWTMLALMLLLALTPAGPARAQAAGRLVPFDQPSHHVATPRVTVWLPPDYATDKRRYGVLYMADGQNLFDAKRAYGGTAWGVDRALARLIASRRIAPVIVVAIDHAGKDRFRQYMPVAPAELAGAREGIERVVGGPLQSDAYLRYLVDELKPAIDRAYRTMPDRRHTAIAGSSMGGLISLYALAKYPTVFGHAACLSTHWPVLLPEGDAAPAMREQTTAMWTGWLARGLGAPAGRRLWFDHGDRTLDRWYAPYQQAVDGSLVRLGWRRGRDFESRVYPGAAHSEASWAARLDEVLAWLLR